MHFYFWRGLMNAPNAFVTLGANGVLEKHIWLHVMLYVGRRHAIELEQIRMDTAFALLLRPHRCDDCGWWHRYFQTSPFWHRRNISSDDGGHDRVGGSGNRE